MDPLRGLLQSAKVFASLTTLEHPGVHFELNESRFINGYLTTQHGNAF